MYHTCRDGFETHQSVDGLEVVANSRGIQLLYNSSSKLFVVHYVVSNELVCSTSNWSHAYRSWLEILKQEDFEQRNNNDPSFSSDILQRQFELRQLSPFFGRLIYQRDRDHFSLLQYAVQLDSDLAVSWKPVVGGSLGQLQVETISWRRYFPAKWVEASLSEDILKALQYSAKVLHQQWPYNIFQFNNEHWARVVTTGECSCYQTEELRKLSNLKGNKGLTDVLEENLYIKKIFSLYG